MPSNAHCALYLRSSKDRHEVSIDAQRRELLALAARSNLAVATEFADAVESANDVSRPGFQALLRALADTARGWSTLLVLDTSRIARDVYLAETFKHECRRRGVKIVFAKLPSANPLVDLVVMQVFHAFDQMHSMMSREKGLAGMAENVRQGFRAGGRAPFGYDLQRIETGAVRDGQAVAKSRLVPNAHAPTIARYLKGRAAGLHGRALCAELGIKLSASTLVGIEWNALTYAGHTVWNVARVRVAGGYEGATKRRPRTEWVVQHDTHPAVITTEEAEQLLARLDRRHTIRTRGDAYLLSGILVSPDGRRWHGDSGYYRHGTRKVTAEALETAILDKLAEDLTSEAFVRVCLEAARKAVKPSHRQGELRVLQRQADELNRQAARVRALLPQMRHPEALLPKLDELEEEKAAVDRQAAAIAGELAGERVLTMITEQDVAAVLRTVTTSLQTQERAHLKQRLRSLLEKVVLDPDGLKCCLAYAIPVETGVSVASPRRTVANPLTPAVIHVRRRVTLHGFRRAA